MPSTINIADAAALVYREARLLDSNRFEEWLALYSDDAVYAIPSVYQGPEQDQDSLHTIYLDRLRLADYARRMKSSQAIVTNPPPRAVRLLGNLAETESGDFEAAWNLHLVRGEESSIFAGRATFALTDAGGTLLIRRKTVRVANDSYATGYMPLI